MLISPGPFNERVLAATLLLVSIGVLALLVATDGAAAEQITSDTIYRDENLVFTEDVEVTNGAKLTLKGCDITFRPPTSAPLYLRVLHGSLEITDTDFRGEGSGFIILSYGDSVLRNVTASGLGAQANSSLASRGLPLVGLRRRFCRRT